MRTLKLIEHISLDGVIQVAPNDDGFPYADWTASYRTPAGRDMVMAAHGERFDLLLGRRTYDGWSSYWPTAPQSAMGDRINNATKYVVTHRPESVTWGPVQPIGPDLVEAVRQIKAQSGPDLVLSGSGSLTTTLLEAGLAEEVVLIVYPVLLGTGQRFLAEGMPACRFELQDSQRTPTGVMLNSYTVAGHLPRAV